MRVSPYLEVPVGLVQAAVTCYGAYTAEIDEWIDLNEREAAEDTPPGLPGTPCLSGEALSLRQSLANFAAADTTSKPSAATPRAKFSQTARSWRSPAANSARWSPTASAAGREIFPGDRAAVSAHVDRATDGLRVWASDGWATIELCFRAAFIICSVRPLRSPEH